ncbi:hypothetical protein KDH_11990 [Dictyobacter sp. S3.2.2.5]|uniref:Fido domain-containing protein n=1 Tax=Dictyobacter halimunensis TaxID=3026934 RepID=A0ABQ6FM63_9CHLR|nr:hypothetical protein KDH_11990 [Dictyobacter sp. S3.2.2.5]
MLANIPLATDGNPRFENLFLNLPDFLRETAFIDRIHGIVPGWQLPRIEEGSISKQIGFKADFFGDIIHTLRHTAGYEDYIKAHGKIIGTHDVRDRNAIIRLATGYLKLLFPDLKVSQDDLVNYCLRPAASLRQLVRDQLTIMDPEYKPSFIDVAAI